MYKKIALAGGTAAVIIGLGTAALAESGAVGATPSPTTSSSSSASGSASGANGTAGAGVFGKLRRVAHGSIVAKDKNGTFVTHDVAQGQVSAVSATGISIKTPDNTTQTFVVNAQTKVRIRSNGKGADGTIAQVAVGDTAVVLGTGSGTMTATHIAEVKK